MDIRDRAVGHWPRILSDLGVEGRYLRRASGPCPFCGGKDRYWFSDHEQRGKFYCRQCGFGDGFDFLCRWHGWSFKQAAEEVEKLLPGMGSAVREDQDEKRRRAAEKLNQVRQEAVPASEVGDVVAYLEGRGLIVPPGLEAHTGLEYWHADDGNKPYVVGKFPAMLGRLRLPSGKPVTYHRTYLSNGRKAQVPGSAKKVMGKTRDSRGGAVQLFPADEELGIAEGIETAIAAHLLYGIPVWSVLHAEGMVEFDPPEGVRSLCIFADNDWSYTGQAAAYAAAKRLKLAKEYRPRRLEVAVYVPPMEGDWNDVLLQQRRAAA